MQKLITLKDLSYSIPYSDSILEGVNFEVHEGEFFGILGHNGAGKTTFMDLLMGFRKATAGEIHILGEDPHAIVRNRLKEIVFLSQDVVLKGSITIRQFLDFHSSFYPAYSREEEEHLLKVFQLNPEQKIGALSTGQQKKVQVVSAFATCPKLILIDEITAVMDPETRALFFRELARVRSKFNSAILLATNIAEDLVERTDKILFIEGKKASLHSPGDIAGLFRLTKEAA